MSDNNDLPPGYESLNDDEIAEAKRQDEECRGVWERRKEEENRQRDEAMRQAIHSLQHGGVM